MSWCTQEDIRATVAGLKLAKEMKDDIILILKLVVNMLVDSVPEGKSEEVFRVAIGEVEDSFYYLSFYHPRLDQSMYEGAVLHRENPSKKIYPLVSMELSLVKPVYDSLPRVLEKAEQLFPAVGSLVRALINFVAPVCDIIVKKRVRDYVMMIIGAEAESLGPDLLWQYREGDEIKSLKIDYKYIEAVEARLGFSGFENIRKFRDTIRRNYLNKVSANPNYDFMDNQELVTAVSKLLADMNR